MAYDFDPELAAILPHLPATTLDDIGAAREWIAGFAANAPVPDESGLDIVNRTVPGLDGDPDVAVRVFCPAVGGVGRAAGDPDIHGGGFVLGTSPASTARRSSGARAGGVVVVASSTAWRPSTPIRPASTTATPPWLAGRRRRRARRRHGPARRRTAQCAGGGLAAGLALLARDRGGPKLCFQFLGIPELDDRLETTSMRAFVDTPMWHRPNAERSWRSTSATDGARRVAVRLAGVRRPTSPACRPPT